MKYNLENIPCFGVAGNFTGHLEQAGEAVDFAAVKTDDAAAPKAIFPTYIPSQFASDKTPFFLTKYPFDEEKIIFPQGEEKIQLEPECAFIFDVEWKDGKISRLTPKVFGASNDVSIRKQGARKISEKKNWGKSSKGFSSVNLPVESFEPGSSLDRYRIASFLKRENNVVEYGEDSALKSYSYFYSRLLVWAVDKLNCQKDEGPAEDLNSYFNKSNLPSKIMISVGATRYTPFGQTNFLQNGDYSVVAVYDSEKYSHEEVLKKVEKNDIRGDNISILIQQVVV